MVNSRQVGTYFNVNRFCRFVVMLALVFASTSYAGRFHLGGCFTNNYSKFWYKAVIGKMQSNCV